jgi:hypothetical protein
MGIMPNLIYYIPNHSYSVGDTIYESNLDANFFVRDPDNDPSIDANSFMISTTDDDLNIVQFTTTVTTGFVREVDTSAGTTTISGLDHLEGETVKVTSGGAVVATETVSDGSITVSSDVFTYQVGLPYKMKVRTMRLAVPQESGTIQTRIKRINETVTRYVKSIGGKAGVEYDGTEYLTDINAEFSNDSADTDKDARLSKGGFNEDAYTVIRSDDPLPFTGIATIVSFEVEERR